MLNVPRKGKRYFLTAIHPAEVFPLIVSVAVIIQGLIFAGIESKGLSNYRVSGCTGISEVVWTSRSPTDSGRAWRRTTKTRADGAYNSFLARTNHNSGFRRGDGCASAEKPKIPTPRQKERTNMSGRRGNANYFDMDTIEGFPRGR